MAEESGILYALVARGSIVLAEHSNVSGNANLVAHRILEKLGDESRVSYTQDRHMFHILRADGLTFLCMAEEGLGRRIPFAFLEDVKQRFITQYGAGAQRAAAYEFNTEFSPVLSQRMEYFSKDPNADTISRVKGGMAEVKNIMIENIEKVLDRGERIELLVDKTEHLQAEAFTFKREARRLKTRLWWKNKRLLAFILLLVLVLFYAIVCIVCSPTFHCS